MNIIGSNLFYSFSYLMNFFRTDLDLKKKWWHRLIMVLWIISIVFVLFICYWYVRQWYNRTDYSCRRTQVWDLRSRLTNEVEDMTDILREFEYIDVEQRTKFDIKNLFHPERWTVWCSNKWDWAAIKKLETLSHRNFSNPRWAKYNSLSDYEEIASEITFDPCVRLDIDGVFHYNQWDNYYIFTKPCPEASKVTMWGLLPRIWWSVVSIVLYLCLSLFIYYKGILYIIYWSPNK